MSAKIATLRGPQDVLRSVPALVGFVPTESYVILVLINGVLFVTVRMDLGTSTEERNEVVLRLMAKAYETEPNSDRVDIVSVVYTAGNPFEVNLDHLSALHFVGHRILDSMWVTSGWAGSYFCDAECCPFLDPSGEVSEVEQDTMIVRQTRDEKAASFDYQGPLDSTLVRLRDTADDVVASLTVTDDGMVWTDQDTATLAWALLEGEGETKYARRDRVLAHVAVAGIKVPDVVIQATATHTQDPSVLACLACFAYMKGDGALTRILLERGGIEAGLGKLVDAGISQALSPASLVTTFASAFSQTSNV